MYIIDLRSNKRSWNYSNQRGTSSDPIVIPAQAVDLFAKQLMLCPIPIINCQRIFEKSNLLVKHDPMNALPTQENARLDFSSKHDVPVARMNNPWLWLLDSVWKRHQEPKRLCHSFQAGSPEEGSRVEEGYIRKSRDAACRHSRRLSEVHM